MRQRERGAWIGDAILAAALAILSVVAAAVLSGADDPPRPADTLGYGLILVACGALAARRRFPVSVLAVSSIAVAAYLLLGYPYGPVMLSLAVAVYTVCRRLRTAPAILLSTVAFLLLVAHIFVNPAALPGLFGVIPAAAWVAIPATIGIARGLILEARARERAALEQRLREQERLRIAHEVHDVVGHGLAAIQMQADIALHLASAKPEQGILALRAISAASSAALVELRDALREIVPPDRAQGSRSPAAGLARLDDLCQRIRTAGVDVRLTVTGEPRRVDDAVDLAAYRIVQESLTNVVKHAVSPRATVELEYSLDGIALTITSPHDGTAVHEGFGIRGIRDRVSTLGGTVAIRAGESLQLRITLPDRESVASSTDAP
jgi:signal transduction histidine kinase